MILSTIQKHLESFYNLQLPYRVEKFFSSQPFKKEILLIRQSMGQLELLLLIDGDILRHLEKYDPYSALGPHNLDAFCTVIEGVSHFLYVAKKALENKPVTRLELELQAEVDKYLLVCFLYLEQEKQIPEFLFSRLFENFNLDPNLKDDEKQRYQEANHLAAKFCAFLARTTLYRRQWQRTLETARHFYHLNHWKKIAHLTP
jgi:hypothetical protein